MPPQWLHSYSIVVQLQAHPVVHLVVRQRDVVLVDGVPLLDADFLRSRTGLQEGGHTGSWSFHRALPPHTFVNCPRITTLSGVLSGARPPPPTHAHTYMSYLCCDQLLQIANSVVLVALDAHLEATCITRAGVREGGIWEENACRGKRLDADLEATMVPAVPPGRTWPLMQHLMQQPCRHSPSSPSGRSV